MANKRNLSKAAPILGVAAIGLLAAMGSASAAPGSPVNKISLDSGYSPVVYRGGGSDLHAYPAGPGFWGKGAGAGVGHRAGHRHHR